MKITIKEKPIKKYTYGIGQVIEITSGASKGKIYLIAMTEILKINLIDLSTGDRFTESVCVDNGHEITLLEMGKLINNSFKVVDAELIIN